MPVIVIDPSRPLPPMTENYKDALDVGDDTTVIVAAGMEVRASGYDADGISAGLNANLILDGQVYSERWDGIGVVGNVTIGATGGAHGFEYGLYLGDDYKNHTANVINNAGHISGEAVGIFYDGSRNIISNSGEITGDVGIYSFGHYDSGAEFVLHNTGLIRGTSGQAIAGELYTANLITNQGSIEGSIFCGDGNDVYDGRNGTITGEVNLWSGDDVAYGGDSSEAFYLGPGINFVDGGAGSNTLRYLAPATVDLRVTDQQQTSSISWDTIRNIENLSGGYGADHFIGNSEANALTGAGGNDTLEGNDGNDLLTGGKGNDRLSGGNGNDIATFSGNVSDYTIKENADHSFTITDSRPGGDGSDTLIDIEYARFDDRTVNLSAKLASVDSAALTSASDVQTGAAQVSDAVQQTVNSTVSSAVSQVLHGAKHADLLRGAAGDDVVNGGLGADTLIGGDGSDTFAFTTKLGKGNVDHIVDFEVGQDLIQLSHAIFQLHKGALSEKAFHIGAKATNSDQHILYNDNTGTLSYDADGSGGKKAEKFAILKAHLDLSAASFHIV